jgi:hypothetical protein
MKVVIAIFTGVTALAAVAIAIMIYSQMPTPLTPLERSAVELKTALDNLRAVGGPPVHPSKVWDKQTGEWKAVEN